MGERIGDERPLAQEQERAGRSGGKPEHSGADRHQRGVVAGLQGEGGDELVHATSSCSMCALARRPP